MKQLPKELKYIKNKLSKTPKTGKVYKVKMTQRLAFRLLIDLGHNYDGRPAKWDYLTYFAFCFLSGTFDCKEASPINLNIKNGQLLDGRHILGGFIISAIKSCDMYVAFSDIDASDFIDTGALRNAGLL